MSGGSNLATPEPPPHSNAAELGVRQLKMESEIECNPNGLTKVFTQAESKEIEKKMDERVILPFLTEVKSRG